MPLAQGAAADCEGTASWGLRGRGGGTASAYGSVCFYVCLGFAQSLRLSYVRLHKAA
jgi:hypothetical protein